MLRCNKSRFMLHRTNQPTGSTTMFEQFQQPLLSFTKQYAQTLVKANEVAVDHFEKLVEMQLKTLENRSNAVADFVEQAAAVKGMEEVRALMPKGVGMVKEHAETMTALGQDLGSLFSKTAEQFVNLAKGQFESANDTVVKAAKVAKR
jgi:uncharacterized protein YfaA (DUF2138 family)